MQPDQTPNVIPTTSPELPAASEQAPRPAAPELQPASPAGQAAAPVSLTPPVAIPIPNPQPIPSIPPVAPTGRLASGPALADDVDVIEKEWVDQADKVVAQTKNDPYAEEEAVESLQIDYLKKRYGHDVKKTESS